MTLPPDIIWTFKLGDVWSSKAFREPVFPWMRAFQENHPWAVGVSVRELFLNPGIHRRQPFGRHHRAGDPRTVEEGFSASDAPKVLRFRARRLVDRKVLEVAHEYPKGALTTSEGIAASLVLVGASLDAENDRLPI